MPRRCTVCDYSERHSIDETLVTGAPYRSVAMRFGLSESAVYRYKSEHLPAHLLKAREAPARSLRGTAGMLRCTVGGPVPALFTGDSGKGKGGVGHQVTPFY
jgi:hypothetical protein